METAGVSVASYAQSRGLSRRAVFKALKTQRIERLPNGNLDPAACDRLWLARTRGGGKMRGRGGDPPPVDQGAQLALRPAPPAPEPPPPPPPRDELADARRRKEMALAEIAELDARRKSGELVSLREVEDARRRYTLVVSERLRGLAASLAPTLAGMTDILEIERVLDARVREALAASADELERQAERLEQPPARESVA